MAKTVGLPVAIAALKILNKEISTPGVLRPIAKEVYEPILEELENYGMYFLLLTTHPRALLSTR